MAAAVDGESPLCLDKKQACVKEREVKRKQMALMEKLRTKQGAHHKSWTDSLMKSMRSMSAGDQKPPGDSSERHQVQSCLYTLQRAMKGLPQQSLVERLEVVARHQGLVLVTNSSEESCVTLKADMFHIEIILGKAGTVKEVKIAHQGDASICHELTDILSRGDFPEFTSHLEGLQSIYQVTEEKKLKPKIFLALQSLEKDLNDLAQFQNSISGVANYIHKSPLGILLPRSAGKPMKLIYFVSPYDLLDKKTMSAHPMTVEAITDHGLGRSVTVCLESGPASKLQTMPLMSISKNLPSFNGLTHANSANLPACFVLVLPQPVPMALSLLNKIHSLTKLDVAKDMGTQPLLSLILDSNSGGKLKKEQQLFVSLPDQDQCYFISGVSGGVVEEMGVMVSRIPFTHPTHVPKILMYLRQQLLFNSLMASCVRPAAKKDVSSSLVFEMTLISLTQMMVVFEHPAQDSMVTVDMDLSDITNLKCCVMCTSSDFSLCSDDYASRVLQRCLSLPVLLRSMVRKGRSQLEQLMAEARALAEEQARRAQEAALWIAAQLREQQARLPPTMPSKARPPPPQPPPHPVIPLYPPTPSPITSNPPSVGDLPMIGGSVDFLGSSPPAYSSMVGEAQDKGAPLLVNLLDGEGPTPPVCSTTQHHAVTSGGLTVTESPMLSKLLEDNISVATNITPMNAAPHTLHHHHPPPPAKVKGTKGRKRRSQSDAATGRSPKHRLTDSDSLDRFGSMDFESSSSPFDSSMGSGGGMGMYHPHHSIASQAGRPSSQGHMGSVIDLTEDSMPESSLKKLVNFSNFMPTHNIRGGNSTPESDLHALLSEQELSNSPSGGMRPTQQTGSKNENASTSPEGFLIGSGGVGKAYVADPGAVRPHSASSHTAIGPFLGHGQATRASGWGHPDPCAFPRPAGGLHHRVFNSGFPRQQGSVDGRVASPFPPVANPTHRVMSSPFSTNPSPKVSNSLSANPGSRVPNFLSANPISNVSKPLTANPGSKVSYPLSANPNLKVSSGLSVQHRVMSSSSMTETCELKPSSQVWRRGEVDRADINGGVSDQQVKRGDSVCQSPHVISSSVCTPVVEGESQVAPRVRLKLQALHSPCGQSQPLDTPLTHSPSSGSRSSSNTFDFCSDDDDDQDDTKHSPSEHFSVYASSPTRLQISSRGRQTSVLPDTDNSMYVKPEKYKRRDKSSGNAKHKKGRSDSKKQKKRKKHDPDFYPSSGRHTLYRASTIEGDCKTGTRLKIRVSKQPLGTTSPVKERYHVDMHSDRAGRFSDRVGKVFRASPVVEKLVLHRQDRDSVSTAHHSRLHRQDRGSVSTAHHSRLHSVRPVYQPAAGKAALRNTNGMVDLTDSTSRLQEADPKLAKATICLEPLNLNSALSSSVCLSEQKSLSRMPSVLTCVSAPTPATVSVINSRSHGPPEDCLTSPSVHDAHDMSDEGSETSDSEYGSSFPSTRPSCLLTEGGGTVSNEGYSILDSGKKAAGSRIGKRSRLCDSLTSASLSTSHCNPHRGTISSPVLSEQHSCGNINLQAIAKIQGHGRNSARLGQNCAMPPQGDVDKPMLHTSDDRSGHHAGVYNGDMSMPSAAEPFVDEVEVFGKSQTTSEDSRYNGMIHRNVESFKQKRCWEEEKSMSIRKLTSKGSRLEHFPSNSPLSPLIEHQTDHRNIEHSEDFHNLGISRPADLHKQHGQVSAHSEQGSTSVSPQCPNTSASQLAWSPISDSQGQCASVQNQSTGFSSCESPTETVVARTIRGHGFSDDRLTPNTAKQPSEPLSVGQREGAGVSVSLSSSGTGVGSQLCGGVTSGSCSHVSSCAPCQLLASSSQNPTPLNTSSSSVDCGSDRQQTAMTAVPGATSPPLPLSLGLGPQDLAAPGQQTYCTHEPPRDIPCGSWLTRHTHSPALQTSISSISLSPSCRGFRSDRQSPQANQSVGGGQKTPHDPGSPCGADSSCPEPSTKYWQAGGHKSHTAVALSQQSLGHNTDIPPKCSVKSYHEGSFSASKHTFDGSANDLAEVPADSMISGISNNNDPGSLSKHLTLPWHESAFSSITTSGSVTSHSSDQSGVKVKKVADTFNPSSKQPCDMTCGSVGCGNETASSCSRNSQTSEDAQDLKVGSDQLDSRTVLCAAGVTSPNSICAEHCSDSVQGQCVGTSRTNSALPYPQSHTKDPSSSVSATFAKGMAQNEGTVNRAVMRAVPQAQITHMPLCTSSTLPVTATFPSSLPPTVLPSSGHCVDSHGSGRLSYDSGQTSMDTTAGRDCDYKEGGPQEQPAGQVSGTLSQEVQLQAQHQECAEAVCPAYIGQEATCRSGSKGSTGRKQGQGHGEGSVFGSWTVSDPLDLPEQDPGVRSSPRDSRCLSPAVRVLGGRRVNGELGRDRPWAGREVVMTAPPRSPLLEHIGHNNTISDAACTHKALDRLSPVSPVCDPCHPEISHGENCSDAQSSVPRPVVTAAITSVFPSVKRVGELSGKTLAMGKRSPSHNACGKSSLRPTSHLRLSPTHTNPSPGRGSCDIDSDLMDATLVSFSAS